MKLLDTTFLIDFLKNDAGAIKKARESYNERLFTTEINVYEVVLGIYSLRGDFAKELNKAEGLFQSLNLLDLNHQSALSAAKIFGTLTREGSMIDHNDCLTAGIALANDVTTIITRNKEHFSRIKGIKVEMY